jgi:putative FmdB family regulatory protein
MPIYEYICDECSAHYEQVVLSASQEVVCPNCSSPRHTLQLSVFNARANSRTTDSSGKVSSSPGGMCGCGAGGCGCN